MDNRIMRLIIALGKFSAQPRQYRIMEGLNASETGVFWAMTQIIAEKPDTRPNLSQTINKLEDKGYVERVVLKDDRRVTYIRLTENGKATAKAKYDEIFVRLENIAKILGEEDTDKLIELVLRFADAYEKSAELK